MAPSDQAEGCESGLRVLLVTDSLDVGGAERHVVDLGMSLQEIGHRVTVACSSSGLLAGELATSGVRLEILGPGLVKRRVSLPYARAIRDLLRTESFDVVHAHVFASAAACALALMGSNVPLVVTEHSEAAWQKPLDRRIARWTRRRATRVIAVSEPIRRHLVQVEGLDPQNIVLMRNALRARPRAFQGRSAHLPGGPGCQRVGVICRLQYEKGVQVFLQAVTSLARNVPKAHYFVIGDGPERAGLERMVEDLGLGGRVHFLGFRADARLLLCALDILVVPSLTEGAPLVVLEAMDAGVAVVATSVGGIPDQIRHEREGLLVPPGDAPALADSVLRLLRSSEHRNRLISGARDRLAKEFVYSKMIDGIDEVYRSVIRSHGVGSRETQDVTWIVPRR